MKHSYAEFCSASISPGPRALSLPCTSHRRTCLRSNKRYRQTHFLLLRKAVSVTRSCDVGEYGSFAEDKLPVDHAKPDQKRL